MPKTFYTDVDIEDLAARGVTTLEVNDNVVLTDLAREKARRLGVQLVSQHDKPPGAPERPYLASQPLPSSTSKPALQRSSREDLHKRVHAAVVARLGEGVDAKLLDTIIRRVLNDIGAG